VKFLSLFAMERKSREGLLTVKKKEKETRHRTHSSEKEREGRDLRKTRRFFSARTKW